MITEWFFKLLTVSAKPMDVPIRWLGTVILLFIALVKRVAVPPARADGGRVDIGRADVRPLWKKNKWKKTKLYQHYFIDTKLKCSFCFVLQGFT